MNSVEPRSFHESLRQELQKKWNLFSRFVFDVSCPLAGTLSRHGDVLYMEFGP